MKLFAVFLYIFVTAAAGKLTDKVGIVCNTGNDIQSVCSDETIPGGGEFVCMSYDFRCNIDDRACSSDEIATHAIKHAQHCGSTAMCKQFRAVTNVYKNLECCDTDFCNV